MNLWRAVFVLGRKNSWPLEFCHLQLADFGCFLPCGPSFWMKRGCGPIDVLWSIVSIGCVCGIQMHLWEFSCDKSCSSSGRDSAPKWPAFCAVVEWWLCDRGYLFPMPTRQRLERPFSNGGRDLKSPKAGWGLVQFYPYHPGIYIHFDTHLP